MPAKGHPFRRRAASGDTLLVDSSTGMAAAAVVVAAQTPYRPGTHCGLDIIELMRRHFTLGVGRLLKPRTLMSRRPREQRLRIQHPFRGRPTPPEIAKQSQLSGLALNDFLQADRGQPSQRLQKHRSNY